MPEIAGGKNGMTRMRQGGAGLSAKVFAVMAMTSLGTFTVLTAVYETFFERQLFA